MAKLVLKETKGKVINHTVNHLLMKTDAEIKFVNYESLQALLYSASIPRDFHSTYSTYCFLLKPSLDEIN